MCPRPTNRHTPPTKGERRAFTNVGGPVVLQGPRASSYAWLPGALEVNDEDVDDARRDVHGFHSYPARLHPVSAAKIVSGLTRPGATLLDPFCGSGTILVEARVVGCTTIGVDANPLAIELTRLKLEGSTDEERFRLLESAERVSASAEARRVARAGATRRYPPADMALFEPHVLLELDGLKNAIQTVSDEPTRRMLGLVLSAILTKVSRKRGDSSQAVSRNRLAAGYTIRLFRAKAKELVERLEAYALRLSVSTRDFAQPSPPPCQVRVGDARDLTFLTKQSVDVVVTSPPYPGTYDYLAHHVDRLRWLGLDSREFERSEIGARRRLERLSRSEALNQWQDEFSAALKAMERVLRPDGTIALVLADSILGGAAVFAEDMTARLAPRAGLAVVAIASQVRPHFHRPTERAFSRRPRREHVIVLEKRQRLRSTTQGPTEEASGSKPNPSPERAPTTRCPPFTS